MIHPALAAALTPEKMELSALPEKEPITRVEYRSIPLRGTEPRDASALGLKLEPKRTRSRLSAKTGTDINEQDVRTLSGHERIVADHLSSALTEREKENMDVTKDVSYREPMLSMLNSERAKSITQASAQANAVTPRYHQRNKTPLTPLTQQNVSVEQTGPGIATNSSKSGFWQGIFHMIKGSIHGGARKKDNIEYENPESSDKTTPESPYTEKDVNQMVSDIMHSIQLHGDEADAHREMLKSGKRWSDGDEVMQRTQHLDNDDILLMRTKVLIDPETLAEALSVSAQKILLSKRMELPNDSESNMRIAVQTRLADQLRHIN